MTMRLGSKYFARTCFSFNNYINLLMQVGSRPDHRWFSSHIKDFVPRNSVLEFRHVKLHVLFPASQWDTKYFGTGQDCNNTYICILHVCNIWNIKCDVIERSVTSHYFNRGTWVFWVFALPNRYSLLEWIQSKYCFKFLGIYYNSK